MAYSIPLRHCLTAFAMLACCALAACAAAPVQEMSNARQAIRAAHDAGAEHVAAQQLIEARTFLERAEASLQSREYRFKAVNTAMRVVTRLPPAAKPSKRWKLRKRPPQRDPDRACRSSRAVDLIPPLLHSLCLRS
jgi:hypothetical protein